MKKLSKKIEANSLYGLIALAYDFNECVIDNISYQTDPIEHDLLIEENDNGNI